MSSDADEALVQDGAFNGQNLWSTRAQEQSIRKRELASLENPRESSLAFSLRSWCISKTSLSRIETVGRKLGLRKRMNFAKEGLLMMLGLIPLRMNDFARALALSFSLSSAGQGRFTTSSSSSSNFSFFLISEKGGTEAKKLGIKSNEQKKQRHGST